MNDENTQEMASPGQRLEVGVITSRYATDELTHEEAQILIGNPKPIGKVIKDAIRNYLDSIPKSLAQMIKSLNLDWVDPGIDEKYLRIFPVNRDEYDLETVHYGKEVSIDLILKDLAKNGLEAADISDLCEYGEKNPEEQREHPIISLGTIIEYPDGDCSVACLGGNADKRVFALHFCDADFHAHDRFLVRKKRIA